jgi:hypothetical protein
MNRYIRQFLSLLDTVGKKVGQQICDHLAARIHERKSLQPDLPQGEEDSLAEITRRVSQERESEQSEIASTAKSNRNKHRQCNRRRKSKQAKLAEERSKQEIAYAEAKAKGDKEGAREYWKWVKRCGVSTAAHYTRSRGSRKAARKIAAKHHQTIGAEAKRRNTEIELDAQCELPENIMIEHLEDHRDGIGWSIAALAKKRFHIRRTLKSNDPNGDMFCEVDDNGESLLKAVKRLISEHDRFGQNK